MRRNKFIVAMAIMLIAIITFSIKYRVDKEESLNNDAIAKYNSIEIGMKYELAISLLAMNEIPSATVHSDDLHLIDRCYGNDPWQPLFYSNYSQYIIVILVDRNYQFVNGKALYIIHTSILRRIIDKILL